MKSRPVGKNTLARTACVALLPLGVAVQAQVTSAPSAAAPSAPTSGLSSDPNPYYIGASQAFTHDSNVYRTPNGPGDTFSSTSLYGGFEQAISRQRLHGRASVSVNRYFDQDQLNNLSYNLSTGIDWETIQSLSGSVNVGAGRSLAAPAASAGVPAPRRNVAESESIDAAARWGGASLFSIDAGVSYSRLDYTAAEYVTAESRQGSASFGGHYRPGGPLTVGVALRFTRTKTPKAYVDTTTGEYQSVSQNGKNVDLLASYNLSGLVSADGRVSYTRQSNSNVSDADFSGVTGSLGLSWRPTGKTSVRLDASRDAGFDTSSYSTYTIAVVGTSVMLTPLTVAYENNRVTNNIGLSADYSATSKVSVTAGLRYSRAKLLTTSSTSVPVADTTDTSKSASLGASYAFTRNISTGCNLAHENRHVSGGVGYSYGANVVGCSAQITLR